MQMTAFEGIIENGRVRLTTNIRLPENTKVYVLIPDSEDKKMARIFSPRLVHPEQAAEFKKEVIEESLNAGV